MRDRYDVIVIGGGIHGVGVAQAVAAAGHSVLLLEKTALAAGTSSRSSKLIHGGLRYLERGEIPLVRECLRERALLLKLAPDLVHMRAFHFPVYRTSRRPAWQVRAGLTLYALLAGLRRDGRFEKVPRREWADLDGLSTDGLRAVYRYHDAQTDDVQLAQAVMRSALDLGAELAAPAEFTEATRAEDGFRVSFQQPGGRCRCLAQVLVNAAGPWANAVSDRITPLPPKRDVDLVQGAHLVLPGRLEHGIYYLESPRDGRAVFVMPWHERIMIGTTEVVFTGDPDDVQPRPEEVTYLLEVLHHHFPVMRNVGAEQVESSFAGLRVLPAGRGGITRRTRETILVADRPVQPCVLTIYGGKLTAYRATAEKVMQRLAPSLPSRTPIADTRTLPLAPPDEMPPRD